MVKKQRRAAEGRGGLEIVPRAEPLPLGHSLVLGREVPRRPSPAIPPAVAPVVAVASPATGKRRVSRGERRQLRQQAPVSQESAPRVPAAVAAAAAPAPRKKRRKEGQAPAVAAAAAPALRQRRRQEAPLADSAPATGNGNTFVPKDGPYTYEPDPDDHCETDIRAYQHLKPVLKQLEKSIYKTNAGDLRIWDPYYCNGGTVKNLATLGFPKVHNRNEDFYAVLASKKLPAHDVLVTSPPYSGDHIERCMRHCAFSGKPWCVLLPNWVSSKDYFKELLTTAPSLVGAKPEYLGPVGRSYHYWFPKGSERPDHVGNDGRTTPYASSWCIFLPGSVGGMRLMRNVEAQQRSSGEWVTAKTAKGLKWSARKVEERRLNVESRAAAQQTRKASAGAAAGGLGQRLGRGTNRKRRRPAGAVGDDEDDDE